jgi:transposase
VRRVAKIETTAQKKSLHAAERESERVQFRRVEYKAEAAEAILSKLKFLDEAGSNLAMTRLYGRGGGGARVIETVPQNYGENITMLATLTLSGITAPMTINGAVDGVVFKLYVAEVLCPTLSRGDIVVLDNLPAHKVAGVKELIEAKGAKLIYLPPYSPDLNPIEKCWSKIKTHLRKAKARTRAELEKALREALLLITQEDAVGWFRSCGYSIHHP